MKSEDLMVNGKLYSEPEMEKVRETAFNAIKGLLGKGYSRAEVMEAITSDAHHSALTSILKLRIAINRGENPWGNVRE